MPAGVYSEETVPSVPVNSALSSTPVPVNLGAEAVADLIPVATVTAVPAEGNVPAENPRERVSPETEAVNEGRVPADPKGLTEVVFGVTVTVGAETVPAGV